MAAIVLDPSGMDAAIVAVNKYLDALERAARALVSVPLPPDVPSAVRSRAEVAMASAWYEVLSAVRALDGMPADLRRRVVATRQADLDWPLAVGLGTGAVKMFADSFSAAVPSAPALAAALPKDARRQPRPNSETLWNSYRDQRRTAKEYLERTVPAGLRTGAEWAGRVPYPGSGAPWLCRCTTCDKDVDPAYNSVRRGSGCRYCAAEQRGAARRYSHELASEFMRNAGFEPLEEYRSALAKWRCRCLRQDRPS